MAILETFGVIRADGTLDLEKKLAPLPGRVRVRVEPVESDEDFAKRFADLAATWRKETRIFSRMDKIAAHPAYQEIIAMGERVIPLLLADLEKEPDLWFMALREITGAGPAIPPEDAGRIGKMAAAWIAWGRAKGYRWEHAV
jgi:hypothetical protein